MPDNDDYMETKQTDDEIMEIMWDRLQEGINANRRYRLKGIAGGNQIRYDTTKVIWDTDIYIYFTRESDGAWVYNKINANPTTGITCNNDDLLYVVLNDTTTTVLTVIAADYDTSMPTDNTGRILILGAVVSSTWYGYGPSSLDHSSEHEVGGGDLVDHNSLTNSHNLTTDIDHTTIQNIGSNSHTVIDTHLGASNPHSASLNTSHAGGDQHIDWTLTGAGTIHTDNYIEGGDGTDTIAFHTTYGSEISGLAAKSTLTTTDIFLIEDSGASFFKKKVTWTTLESQVDHANIGSIGDNAHSVIDTHLGASNPHSGSEATITYGIVNTNVMKAENTPTNLDFAKFTTTGLEGRSYTETLSDIGAAASGHGHGQLHDEAHVLGTATGPHTGTLPLTDLIEGSVGSIIRRGAADWEEYSAGTDNFTLMMDGSNPVWEDHTSTSAHHTKTVSNDITHSLTTGGTLDDAHHTKVHDLVLHGDVTLSSIGDNEVLAYDNGTSEWINQTAAEASLATAGHGHGQLHDKYALTEDLSANEITQLQAIGDSVTISTEQWSFVGALAAIGSGSIISTAERNALHAGPHTLNSHTNVDITTPGDNDILAYDEVGGDWLNQTAGEAGLATSGHGHGTHTMGSHSDDDTYAISTTGTFQMGAASANLNMSTFSIVGPSYDLSQTELAFLDGVTEDVQTHMTAGGTHMSATNPHSASLNTSHASDTSTHGVAQVANHAEIASQISTHVGLSNPHSIAWTDVNSGHLASLHEDGGSNEISVAGLSGQLADNQPPLAHLTSHQNNGGDEISVTGLSGLLADGQTPLLHTHNSHSGVLSANEGGTGQSAFATGDILYGSAPSTLAKLTAGTLNYVLTSGGPGVAPSWSTAGAIPHAMNIHTDIGSYAISTTGTFQFGAATANLNMAGWGIGGTSYSLTHDELSFLDGVTSSIQDQLDEAITAPSSSIIIEYPAHTITRMDAPDSTNQRVAGPDGLSNYTTTGTTYHYLHIPVPSWLERYAVQTSKTITATTIVVRWYNSTSGDYLTRIIAYESDGSSENFWSRLDDSTDKGNGSTGFRNDSYTPTAYTLAVGDWTLIRVDLQRTVANSCRISAIAITYTIT